MLLACLDEDLMLLIMAAFCCPVFVKRISSLLSLMRIVIILARENILLMY